MFRTDQDVNNQRKKFDMIYDASVSKDFHFNPTILTVNKVTEGKYSDILKLVNEMLDKEEIGGQMFSEEDKNFVAKQLYRNLLKKNMGMNYQD